MLFNRRRIRDRRQRAEDDAPVASIKHGFNVSASSYYDGCGLFNNRLIDAGPLGTGITREGYPSGAIGASISYLLISETFHKWWSYRPGVYKAKGIGTGHRVVLSGAGITTVAFTTTPGVPFVVSVSVPDNPIPAGDAALDFTPVQTLLLTVANVTGKVIADMTTLAVVHAADEADYDAGNFYTASARASFSTASKGPLRPMAYMQTVSGWLKDPADIPLPLSIAKNNRPIVYPGVTFGTTPFRIPSPEAIARLGVEIDQPVWVSMWVMMTDAALKEWFERFGAAYPANLLVYVEGGNEIWNNAYTANSGFLANQYGRPEHANTGLVDSSGTTMQKNAAHFALRCFKAAEAVLGRARVRRTFNLQLVNPGLSMIGLDFVDNVMGTGKRLGELLDSPCVATYFQHAQDNLSKAVGHSGYTDDTKRGVKGIGNWIIGLSRRKLLENRVWEDNAFTQGDWRSWMERSHKNSVDDVRGWIQNWGPLLAAKGYAQIQYSYEGAQSHDDMPSTSYIGQAGGDVVCVMYLFTFDRATGAFTLADGKPTGWPNPTPVWRDTSKVLRDLFQDGELVQFSWDSAMPTNMTYPVRIIDGALYCFANNDKGASYAIGTPAASLKFTASAKPLLTNITRMVQYQEALMSTLWANESHDGTGVNVMDHWHSQMFAAGIRISAGFVLCGGVTSAYRDFTGNKPWAYKPNGYWAPDTALLDWVRSKTG